MRKIKMKMKMRLMSSGENEGEADVGAATIVSKSMEEKKSFVFEHRNVRI